MSEGTRHPGTILRDVRVANGLSLKALAGRSGLPASTLSKLENAKMAMTYDKLVCLAQALQVDIGDLVGATPAIDRKSAVTGRRSVARANQVSSADSDRYDHYFPAADLLGKQMIPIIIDVRARSVEEVGGLIRHAGEEYLFVLDGSMELHSDLYAPLPLATGDSIYFDSGIAHAFVATGDAACRVLSVCVGEGFQRFADAVRPGGKMIGGEGGIRSDLIP